MAIEILLEKLIEKVDALSAQLDHFQPIQDNGKIGLSVEETAELVDVSTTTYRSWINAGYAPGVKINGCRKVSRRALDEWMYQQSKENTEKGSA
jgi:excisionase family DNA binding protein